MKPKLRPCPFCGKAPEAYEWIGKTPRRFFVECSNKECEVKPKVGAHTKELAAVRWNGPDPWQPIATAPKDGHWITAWEFQVCELKFRDGIWVDSNDNRHTPSHWQLLIKGPDQSAEIRQQLENLS